MDHYGNQIGSHRQNCWGTLLKGSTVLDYRNPTVSITGMTQLKSIFWGNKCSELKQFRLIPPIKSVYFVLVSNSPNRQLFISAVCSPYFPSHFNSGHTKVRQLPFMISPTMFQQVCSWKLSTWKMLGCKSWGWNPSMAIWTTWDHKGLILDQIRVLIWDLFARVGWQGPDAKSCCLAKDSGSVFLYSGGNRLWWFEERN